MSNLAIFKPANIHQKMRMIQFEGDSITFEHRWSIVSLELEVL